MKKTILSIVASAAMTFATLGQAPQAFKYQAVVRDASNTIITEQSVGFQLSILEDSITGIPIYSETFTPTSNSYGIINIEIGTGTTVDDFSTIDWANNSYFLETAIDVNGGSSYVVMGTNQFKSVPYALHSKTVEIDIDEQMLSFDNVSGELAISNGNTITLPMTTGGDNWGSQAADTDSTLLGDGTSANPLSVQGDLTDDQNLTGATLTGTSLQIDIDNGTSAIVDLAPLQDGVDDADNDPSNEIELPASGNTNDVLTWDGTEWVAQAITAGADADWSIDGSGNMSNSNSGTVSTTSDVYINGLTVGRGSGNDPSNTSNGATALESNTAGSNNTAIGSIALQANTTGNNNTAIGYSSLADNTFGYNNQANGYSSLQNNTTGNNNTANGASSLRNNDTGIKNTANGSQALNSNTIGNHNTAMGYMSLTDNTTGNYNTANGYMSLANNTTGNYNAANGYMALQYNTTGGYNTATGNFALRLNTEGQFNTANGSSSLQSNTTGNNNVANGRNAGISNTQGNLNTFIGYNATGISGTLNNATAIGANSSVASDNSIQLGDAQITTVNTSGEITAGEVTYPNTDGSAGQVLTTDGAGNLSFQNDSLGVYSAGPGINIVNNEVSVNDAIATIGLHPELGGFVFWVSPDGKHGLVVETQDQGTGNWYDAQNMISNPTSHSPDGQNFRDWRLPTAHELNELHLQEASIGNFSPGNYWSASQVDNVFARSQVLLTGSIESFQMEEQHIIRAVRVFTAIAIPAF